MSDVNHSVVISGEDTLVKITFQVSQFAPHHLHGYTCKTVQASDIIALDHLLHSVVHMWQLP